MAQSVRSASSVLFMPARNGCNAARAAIGSMSLFVFIGVSAFFPEETCLTKFVFLFPDDEHRARSGTHDPLRGPPGASMFAPCVTVGGDNDQIDIGFFRDVDDFVGRDSSPNLASDAFFEAVPR